MDAENIYRQLENAFTYAGKDKVIADHIADLYKQLEDLTKYKKEEQQKGKLEHIDLQFNVEYFRLNPDGRILKRESRGDSYRWYEYRDALMGEQCPPWWWTEVNDIDLLNHFESLYSQAQ